MANCRRSLPPCLSAAVGSDSGWFNTFVATSDKLQSCLPSRCGRAASGNPQILPGKREKAESKRSQVLDNYGRGVYLYR